MSWDRLDIAVQYTDNPQKDGGQLNPTWVGWLMGFPIKWDACEPLETHRFLWWRQVLGSFLTGCFGQTNDSCIFAKSLCGMKRVVLSAECDEDGNCPCGLDYSDGCEQPGPTQDGVEYAEIQGILFGRAEDELV